jgi:hypothetical protein
LPLQRKRRSFQFAGADIVTLKAVSIEDALRGHENFSKDEAIALADTRATAERFSFKSMNLSVSKSGKT